MFPIAEVSRFLKLNNFSNQEHTVDFPLVPETNIFFDVISSIKNIYIAFYFNIFCFAFLLFHDLSRIQDCRR